MYNKSQDGILLYSSWELSLMKKKNFIHLGIITLLGS